jgi:predicted nucleotidyltransferase
VQLPPELVVHHGDSQRTTKRPGKRRYNYPKMKFIESIPQKNILLFCQRWQIRELALFGSALRADFKSESDVDVLVSFSEKADWSLFDHVQMRLDLEAIFKRKVDLVTRRALDQSQNQLLRERILKTAKVVFAESQAAYAEG